MHGYRRVCTANSRRIIYGADRSKPFAKPNNPALNQVFRDEVPLKWSLRLALLQWPTVCLRLDVGIGELHEAQQTFQSRQDRASAALLDTVCAL